MTNETLTPSDSEVSPVTEAPIAPPAVVTPPASAEQMRQKVLDDKAAKIAEYMAKLDAATEKELARVDEKITEEAISNRRGEIASSLHDFWIDLVPGLSIPVPESGLKLAYEFTINHGPNGTLMVNVIVPEKAKAAERKSSGPRAARGTGTSGKQSITAIGGISGYSAIVKGEVETFPNVSKLLKAIGVDFGASAATQYVIGYAKVNREIANEVTVNLADGSHVGLGDLVAEHFATPAVTETTPASAPTLPPPPAV